jgi:hypothetical protein
MSKTIEIKKSECGTLASFTPLINGNIVLPCVGVTCYGEKQIARAGEYLDMELRKVGHTLSEFEFKP